jgi:parallel beta-helix repeat protein
MSRLVSNKGMFLKARLNGSTFAAILSIILLVSGSQLLTPAYAKSLSTSRDANQNSTLVVPTDYPSIQAAINAAKPGDSIKILPGTYYEQLFINKSVTLIGSGVGATKIKPPLNLIADSFGFIWGVHVGHDAMVGISDITFSQASLPYPPCTGNNAVPCATLFVDGGATLELSSDSIAYSYFTNGIWAGISTGPCVDAQSCAPLSIGHINIQSSDIDLGQLGTLNATFIGIYVTDGSSLQVSNSKINSLPTYGGDSGGIYLDVGSISKIYHDTISGGFTVQSNPDVYTDISYSTITPNGLSPFSASPGGVNAGIFVNYGSHASITYNTIKGGMNVFNGIAVIANNNPSDPTDAMIAHNTVSNIQCTNLDGRPSGFCGPNVLNGEGQGDGIVIGFLSYPQSTRNAIDIVDNHISHTDAGVVIEGAENCCIVSNNIISHSTDYGILVADGNYSFYNNTIVEAKYGASVVAGLGSLLGLGSSNTTLVLIDTSLQDITISPSYIQTVPPYTARIHLG